MNVRFLLLPLAFLVAGCSSTPEQAPIESAVLGVYKVEEIQPLGSGDIRDAAQIEFTTGFLGQLGDEVLRGLVDAAFVFDEP